MLKRWFINEKIMKKFLCLILSVLLTASFTACDIENSATSDGSPSPPTSVTPNGSQLPSTSVTPTIKPTTTPDKTTEVDGTFSVSEKKYTFKGNNVMLLNVENTSDTAYSIEITASYKNAGGNNIKSEMISFEGFAPNWSNYFVLNPQISFDIFEFVNLAGDVSLGIILDQADLTHFSGRFSRGRADGRQKCPAQTTYAFHRPMLHCSSYTPASKSLKTEQNIALQKTFVKFGPGIFCRKNPLFPSAPPALPPAAASASPP